MFGFLGGDSRSMWSLLVLQRVCIMEASMQENTEYDKQQSRKPSPVGSIETRPVKDVGMSYQQKIMFGFVTLYLFCNWEDLFSQRKSSPFVIIVIWPNIM